jgi:hypothetical protein
MRPRSRSKPQKVDERPERQAEYSVTYSQADVAVAEKSQRSKLHQPIGHQPVTRNHINVGQAPSNVLSGWQQAMAVLE